MLLVNVSLTYTQFQIGWQGYTLLLQPTALFKEAKVRLTVAWRLRLVALAPKPAVLKREIKQHQVSHVLITTIAETSSYADETTYPLEIVYLAPLADEVLAV